MQTKYLEALFLCLLLFAACQPRKEKCNDIRNGTFQYHPSFSKGNYIIIRSDSLQKEVEVGSNDTSLWSVEWLDECDYKLQYKEGLKTLSKQEQAVSRQQSVYVRILDIERDYYCIKINGGKLARGGELDTIWRNTK